VWSCARGRCFSSPPVKTKRRGLQDGGQASRQEKAEAVNGVASGALSSEAVDANGRSVGADRQTMQGY
jgi:hypothetical protein